VGPRAPKTSPYVSGVARANYFPPLTLTAAAGFRARVGAGRDAAFMTSRIVAMC
jgi:hypothetical protein